MGIKSEKTKNGIKLRQTKTGKLAGSVSAEGKANIPTAAVDLKVLEKEMQEAKSMAMESNQPEAYEDFKKKREIYENILHANAMLVINTLEEYDMVNLKLSHVNEKGERVSTTYLDDAWNAFKAETIVELKKERGFSQLRRYYKVLSIEKTRKATAEEITAWDAEEAKEAKEKRGAEIVEKLLKEVNSFTQEERAILAKAFEELSEDPNINKYSDMVDLLINDDIETVLPGFGQYLPDGFRIPAIEKAPWLAAMYYGAATQLEEDLPAKAIALLKSPWLLVRPDFKI